MEQDKEIIVNTYSLASYYVEIYFNDIRLSNATCFISKQGEKLYLITNWHVVSGKDADTFELLDSRGAIPNKLRIFLPQETEGGSMIFDDSYMELNLYDEEENKIWYEMKKDERMLDIAVIPLIEKNKNFYVPIEDAEEPFNENVSLEIASEIYIIGFPFGRIGGCLPIWKKASVASEPEVNIEDMPYYYADTATKAGMSGSPVVLYENRPVIIAESLNGKFSRHKTKLVGVYSGRIGANTNNQYDAQLGRVWKVEIIKSIIEAYEN